MCHTVNKTESTGDIRPVGFAKIVNPGPEELAGHKWVITQDQPNPLVMAVLGAEDIVPRNYGPVLDIAVDSWYPVGGKLKDFKGYILALESYRRVTNECCKHNDNCFSTCAHLALHCNYIFVISHSHFQTLNSFTIRQRQ
jgi:hypothetical protein